VAVDSDSSADDPEMAASVEGGSGGLVPGADANFTNRVLGGVVDILVAGGIKLGLGGILAAFPVNIGTLAAMAYLLTKDSLPFLNGQSIGKRAMKIQAVTMDGKSLSGNWQPGVIRNVSLVIPLVLLVELIVLLTRRDNPGPLLRLGDEWGKTKVINAGLDVPVARPTATGSSAPRAEAPAEDKSGESGESGASWWQTTKWRPDSHSGLRWSAPY
jgi:uncharacterized RDD family membrane protein YckC